MATQPNSHRYGWIADQPDHRDYLYAAPQGIVDTLPPKVDLRPRCPPIYNQGRIGSCTANAIAGAVQFTRRVEDLAPDFIPSRLFIYWNERNLEHTVPVDSGAQLRDGIKVVHQLGVCPETGWSYDDTPADPASHLWPDGAKAALRPTDSCFAAALNHQATSYRRVARSLVQMKGCLASGYPFVLGFAVYDLFESAVVARTGIVDLPKHDESRLGGHAVLAIGYDDTTQRFLIRNSWGPAWGLKGCFTMPYAYLLDPTLASDFWTIRVVE